MPWKWDQTLWDRDRWMASLGRVFHRLADGALAIRVSTTNEQSWANDVYHLESEQFLLCSNDDGHTWQRREDDLLPDTATTLADGTIVQVESGGATSLEDKQQLIASIKANPDTVGRAGNDLWPEARRAELEQQGYVVETTIPGVVGTLFALSCGRSTDGGRTFQHRRIEGLPRLARCYGSFRRCLELQDGSVLAACVGRRGPATPEFSFALRSEDAGATWSFHPIAEDTGNSHQWNETEIMQLDDGRIIAMMRHHPAGASVGDYLWQCFSADGGRTWSAPEQLPIWGYPPQLTRLADGCLLCTYAHRRHPYGVRACISTDQGRTWDHDNEKIIRDDSLPGLVWYPTSTELADGTLLTACSLSKLPRIPYRPDDTIGPQDDLLVHARKRVGPERAWYGGYHGYVAVSRYSRDWVRAPGQTTSRTGFDQGNGGSGRQTGNDEE